MDHPIKVSEEVLKKLMEQRRKIRVESERA